MIVCTFFYMWVSFIYVLVFSVLVYFVSCQCAMHTMPTQHPTHHFHTRTDADAIKKRPTTYNKALFKSKQLNTTATQQGPTQQGPTQGPTQVPATQGPSTATSVLGLDGATMAMVHLLSALLEAFATLYDGKRAWYSACNCVLYVLFVCFMSAVHVFQSTVAKSPRPAQSTQYPPHLVHTHTNPPTLHPQVHQHPPTTCHQPHHLHHARPMHPQRPRPAL